MKTAQIFLILFVLGLLLCLVGLGLTISSIQKQNKVLISSNTELMQAQKKYQATQNQLVTLSNLIGFREINSNKIVATNVDNLIYFIDIVCTSESNQQKNKPNLLAKYPYNYESLGLKFRNNFPGQTIDSDHKLETTGSANKTVLSNMSFVRNMVTLQDIYKASEQRITDLKKELDSLESKIKDNQKEYDALVLDTQEKVRQLQDEVQSKQTEFDEIIAKNKDDLKKLEDERRITHNAALQEKAQLASLTLEKQKLDASQNLEQKNLDARINELQSEAIGDTGANRILKNIDDLLAKIERQSPQTTDTSLASTTPVTKSLPTSTTEETIAEQFNPDGEILFSDEKSQTAYINLGRMDGISQNMSFDVFTYGKGGKQIKKGKIVVREMQARMSRVGIEELADSFNPIQARDKISNRVYDRNKTKYFVVAGRLSEKYSTDQVRRLVTQIGGQIEDNLSSKTDIVVLGEGYKDDPIFKTAQERGMETILEANFLGYLGSIESVTTP